MKSENEDLHENGICKTCPLCIDYFFNDGKNEGYQEFRQFAGVVINDTLICDRPLKCNKDTQYKCVNCCNRTLLLQRLGV